MPKINKHKIQALPVLMLLLVSQLAILQFIPTVKGATIFESGFESGNFSAWTGTYGTAPTVVSTSIHHGSYAMKAFASGYRDSHVYKDFTTQTNAYARAYVRYDTSTTLDGTLILDNPDFMGPKAGIVKVGGVLYWQLIYYVDGTRYSVRADVGPNLGTWYCLELGFHGGTGGSVKLYVDGALIINITNINTVSSVNKVRVGNFAWISWPQTDWTVSADCVVVADAYIGPEDGRDTQAPTYSNIGTNTTKAGQPCLFHALWNDNVGLSGFIFGSNNAGTWQNDTWTPLTGTAAWSNVTKTLNATVGATVQWGIWVNDTSNNWNNIGIQSLITSAEENHIWIFKTSQGDNDRILAYLIFKLTGINVEYKGNNFPTSAAGYKNVRMALFVEGGYTYADMTETQRTALHEAVSAGTSLYVESYPDLISNAWYGAEYIGTKVWAWDDGGTTACNFSFPENNYLNLNKTYFGYTIDPWMQYHWASEKMSGRFINSSKLPETIVPVVIANHTSANLGIIHVGEHGNGKIALVSGYALQYVIDPPEWVEIHGPIMIRLIQYLVPQDLQQFVMSRVPSPKAAFRIDDVPYCWSDLEPIVNVLTQYTNGSLLALQPHLGFTPEQRNYLNNLVENRGYIIAMHGDARGHIETNDQGNYVWNYGNITLSRDWILGNLTSVDEILLYTPPYGQIPHAEYRRALYDAGFRVVDPYTSLAFPYYCHFSPEGLYVIDVPNSISCTLDSDDWISNDYYATIMISKMLMGEHFTILLHTPGLATRLQTFLSKLTGCYPNIQFVPFLEVMEELYLTINGIPQRGYSPTKWLNYFTITMTQATANFTFQVGTDFPNGTFSVKLNNTIKSVMIDNMPWYAFNNDTVILPLINAGTSHTVRVVFGQPETPHLTNKPFAILNTHFYDNKLNFTLNGLINHTSTVRVNSTTYGKPSSVTVSGEPVSFAYNFTTKIVSFNVTFSGDEIVEINFEDTVIIDQAFASDERADVSSSQTVRFHAKWDNGSDVAGGSIYINNTEYIANSTGWVTFNVNSSFVKKDIWITTGVNCNGVTTYIQTAQTPSIIWDRIKITEGSATKKSLTLGETTTIWFKAVYEYDDTNFTGTNGILYLNGSAMTWSTTNTRWEYTYTATATTATFTISGVFDETHGLTAITDTVGAQSITVWSTLISVISNSTISELTFNSTSKTLIFTVSGQTGTTGFTNVTIAKSLIEDINGLMIYFDGDPINYTIESTDYFWLIHFTYNHSTHKVIINFASQQKPPIITTQAKTTILFIGIAIAILTTTWLVAKRKAKQRNFSMQRKI